MNCGQPMNMIPLKSKEVRELRNKEIRALYKLGYTMEQICKKVDASKTTVFFALRGRAPKKKSSK